MAEKLSYKTNSYISDVEGGHFIPSKEKLKKKIALRLGRSEAGIRNLRYRKGLVRKAKDEVRALFKRRDELRSEVEALNKQQEALTQDLNKLKMEGDKLESVINADKILLRNRLAQALNKPKNAETRPFHFK